MEGMSTFLYGGGGGRVRLSDELKEFTGMSFKVPNWDLRTINNFISVDACVKYPYLY